MKKYKDIQRFLREVRSQPSLNQESFAFNYDDMFCVFPAIIKMDGLGVKTNKRRGEIAKGKSKPQIVTFKIVDLDDYSTLEEKTFEEPNATSTNSTDKLDKKALSWLFQKYFSKIEIVEKVDKAQLKALQNQAIDLKHKFRDLAEMALGL
jgi:hypothetical protein